MICCWSWIKAEIEQTKITLQKHIARWFLVRLKGFEPPAPGVGGQCSIQLSYRRRCMKNRFSAVLNIWNYRGKIGQKSSSGQCVVWLPLTTAFLRVPTTPYRAKQSPKPALSQLSENYDAARNSMIHCDFLLVPHHYGTPNTRNIKQCVNDKNWPPTAKITAGGQLVVKKWSMRARYGAAFCLTVSPFHSGSRHNPLFAEFTDINAIYQFPIGQSFAQGNSDKEVI